MTKKYLGVLLLATSLFGLVNCAKDGGGGKKTATTAANNCSAGSVYHSSYGCLPTSMCAAQGPNYGYYQGQCYAGTANGNSCRGNCGSGQVQTMYGCMKQATSSQCGSQYTCAGYGKPQGSYTNQCVPGIQNDIWYGNNYPNQQYPGYNYNYNYNYQVPYYYYYSYPSTPTYPRYNSGLYFYLNLGF